VQVCKGEGNSGAGVKEMVVKFNQSFNQLIVYTLYKLFINIFFHNRS